ncbi:MAG: EamA family transporter [Desulfobacterales bacterium]
MKGGSEHVGYICVLLAAACWAAGASAAKFLFQSGITPFQLVQLRLTTAVVFLALALGLLRPRWLRVERRDLPYFLLLGTFGMAAINVAYLYAISRLQVAAALVLEYLAPVLIALYVGGVRREPLGRRAVCAIAAAFTGCFFAVGAYRLDLLGLHAAGIASGLAAACAFAWWSVYGEAGMHRYPPWTVLFYALLVAALEWNLLHPPLEAFLDERFAEVWPWVLFIALVGAIVPFGLYFEGINRIRATRASIVSTIEPLLAGLFSFLFLGERLEPLQMAGGGLVIAAVILLQIRPERDERAPIRIRARAAEEARRALRLRGGR